MENKPSLKSRLLTLRQTGVNRLISLIYGQPMQVLPAGHVGLAGAVVLWYLHEGFRHFVLIKNPKVGDGKARFISCLGLGNQADMPAALTHILTQNLGDIFAGTLPKNALNTDKVASAPLFSYTDEALGVTTPVQAMVWVVQIQQPQIELITTGKENAVVLVPEFAMSSNQVSPTHKALYQAVQRQLPKMRMLTPPAERQAEEAISTLGATTPRTIH
ncbi:MAG: hypothetical protein COY40_06605 [Alphaproteobacteria bacterium CG_4_10_14_0_8_um_filter_53_9]|nr:MAG: hypothetical protein COY40_06605 [Alphaproteobacteria bacterium CG_4_10_14_0_8_um_filter_53_9]